jgi:transposase
METGMSQQELQRVEVIALRRSGKINQAEAARRLGVSVRQVRRLEAKVAARGAAGLRSARRGRPSNRRLAAPVVAKVSTLIRAHYRDFGPTLASEYLQERHGLVLSKETVRQIMITAKLWRPQRGSKARLHALRERRARFGELIQIDGSAHAWFEERGPRCCLLVFIDDATSRLTQLRFVPQECTLGYMQALYGHIRQHGLPMTLYSDRHSIFRVNKGHASDDAMSQFGRALHSLGIESICANSPQAKGRVERANGVLQDRLLRALRLDGIDSIEAANAWLPHFIERHNARFAVAPFDAQDAHVPHPTRDDVRLRQILAKHYPRKLSPNLTCQFHSTLLQIRPPASGGSGLRGAAVTVLEHFDHSCEVLWRKVALPHTTLQKARAAPLEQGRQEITFTRRAASTSPPRPNHPWKNSPIGKPSPEFIARR